MEQKITVKAINSTSGKETVVCMLRGENLLEALMSSQIIISGECGGMGRCGKCVIRLVDGVLKITPQDKARFSDSELGEGYRLACMAYPYMDCTIILSSEINYDYRVVTEVLPMDRLPSMKTAISPSHSSKYENVSYAIAIDLGTTTIAIALVDIQEGNILDNYAAINPQRVYGADVVSRIKASNEGKHDIISKLIREELLKGIEQLREKNQISLCDIKRIIVAGNTTMIHLFMEYPCNTLGVFPFTPYKQGFINAWSDEVFDVVEKIPIILIPGVSVFVGGDIIAGLLACGFDHNEKTCLFIDLGTNGEMALGNRERILVTSTAAGPAFEGGNISCGVGGISGAICHVSLDKGHLSYETIDDKPAVGLCGTGVIELISVLIKEGLVDSSGLLVEPYFDDGYPIGGMKIVQKDIRELQLAKAAIRAGVDILIKNYGISYEQIDKVFIAGGFGYHMNVYKAVFIGLLPEALIEKTKSVGNTSLSGAICTLTDSEAKNRIDHIISISEEIHLSNVEEFNDLFITYTSF